MVLRATQIGREARQGISELQPSQICLGVQSLDCQAFWRIPFQILDVTSRGMLRCSLFPRLQIIGIQELFGHDTPSLIRFFGADNAEYKILRFRLQS